MASAAARASAGESSSSDWPWTRLPSGATRRAIARMSGFATVDMTAPCCSGSRNAGVYRRAPRGVKPEHERSEAHREPRRLARRAGQRRLESVRREDLARHGEADPLADRFGAEERREEIV